MIGKVVITPEDGKEKGDLDFTCLLETTITSRSLNIVLDFAMNKTKDELVVFQFTITHPDKFAGFRLNKEQYSAYPHEDEVILAQGIPCYVLCVDELVSIGDHSATVIHLAL